jgi:hypothetical protein
MPLAALRPMSNYKYQGSAEIDQNTTVMKVAIANGSKTLDRCRTIRLMLG